MCLSDPVYLKGPVNFVTACVTSKESLILWGGMHSLLCDINNMFKMKNEYLM